MSSFRENPDNKEEACKIINSMIRKLLSYLKGTLSIENITYATFQMNINNHQESIIKLSFTQTGPFGEK